MITRAMKDENVVWFGSYGKNQDNTAKFYKADKSSYSANQDSVKDGLTQRLSIIKGELWYRINYGLPLFDKVKSKTILDSNVMSIVLDNSDVKGINEFTSTIEGHAYHCYINILTSFGNIEIRL